jgi:hypothetical protein
VFLGGCILFWLISLLICRTKLKPTKDGKSERKTLFHHIDADDIDYQKLMLNYDVKNNGISPALS